MCGQYPEAIVLAPEGLHSRALREVPDAHGFVLTARHDQLVFGVEQSGGDIVEVTSARVNLPCLRLTHSPDLDLPVIRGGDDERKRGMEGRPVNAAVVAL